MNENWKKVAMLGVVLLPTLAFTQQPCRNGLRIDGTITDPTGAVIPGAVIRAATGDRATADPAGHYALPCVNSASTILTVEAEGFAPGTIRASAPLGQSVHVNLQLEIAAVQTDVQVGDDA